MTGFVSTVKMPILPPLPIISTSNNTISYEITPEEFKHRKDVIVDKYYHSSIKNNIRPLLRQISGEPYIMYGVEQTTDWNNMLHRDIRNLNITSRDTIISYQQQEKVEQAIKYASNFAIYHYLVTENLDTKMPKSIFKSYINAIWNTMEKHNMTPPSVPIYSRM